MMEKIKKIIGWEYFYLVFYSAISVAILSRLLLPGYILTLDMIFAPRMQFTGIFFGLKEWVGGAMPFLLALQMMSIFSMHIIQKILLFMIFFISGVSAYHLCPAGKMGKYFAGLIYMVNPFTYVRFLAGHWMLLLAYAIAPIAILSFLRYLENPNWKKTITMILCTTLIAMLNIHTLFLLIFAYIIIFVFKAREKQKDELISLMKSTLFASGMFLLLNIYWILPAITTEATILGQIGHGDIMAFAPKPGFNFNIAFTIASMYGFWRGGYIYTKDLLPFWYLIFGFILYLAVHGAVTTFHDKKLGANTKAFIVVGVIALILGIGVASPNTAPIFNWLFEHVFFFRGFRDSHKFVALLVLAYAYLGGLGLDDFAKHLKGIKKEQVIAVIVVVLALSSPLIYSYTMFGFHDQLKPIDYPESWYEANDFLNQDGEDFNVLFFPWHLYMDFHWIENKDKRIANPASSFFDKPIIQGDNIEVGGIYTQSTDPISRYIEFLLAHRGDMSNFGELIAPINVKYVILAKEVDYRNYDFLYDQEDLEVVLENEDLIVFRNKHETTKVYEVDTINYIQSLDDLLETSETQDITKALYVLSDKTEIQQATEKKALNYAEKSPVRYEVEDPTMKYVIFTTSQGISSDYWEMSDSISTKNLGLTPAFIVNEETDNTITYTRFYNTYLPGYIISTITLTALICIYVGKDKTIMQKLKNLKK